LKNAFLLPFLLLLFTTNGARLPKTKPASLKVKTVVIDAGHGGKDPGCHGELYKEKDIALAVALKLGHYIEDNFKDVKVIFTRKTDVFVELNERAAIANRNNADLFICVHCNSACVYNKRTHKETCNEEAHGSETYVLGIQKNAGNLEVAKRENQSILLEEDYKKKYDGFDPNSDEATIIFTFYQNVFLNQSLSLATKFQECYKQNAGRNDKGVTQAGFLVLWRTAMPSLLTELGFLTNHKEERFLGSEKGQNYMASSMFRAFRMYKNEVEGTNLKYTDEFEKAEPYDPAKDTSLNAPEKNGEKNTSDEKQSPPHMKTPGEEKKSDGGTGSAEKAGTHIKKDSTPDDKYSKSTDNSSKELKTKVELPADPMGLPANVGAEKNGHLAAGLVYKVIFFSSEKKMESGNKKFEGISDISCFEEGGNFKYTAGSFEKSADAAKTQKELRKRGFKDAFVASFLDGKRVK
jgi:N-acetylmuramoyl-L-alanine amidase